MEALRGNSDMKHVVWDYLIHKGNGTETHPQEVVNTGYDRAFGPDPVLVDEGDIEGYLEFLRVFVLNEGRKHLQRDVNAAHTMRCHALTVLGRPVTS